MDPELVAGSWAPPGASAIGLRPFAEKLLGHRVRRAVATAAFARARRDEDWRAGRRSPRLEHPENVASIMTIVRGI